MFNPLQKAHNMADEAIGVFIKTVTKLEKANELLKETIKSEEITMATCQERIAIAETSHKRNTEIVRKISDLIL